MHIENLSDVILRTQIPKIVFEYKDRTSAEKKVKGFDDLQGVLSTGEKRALYFLNVIFKMETIKKSDKCKHR